MTFPDLATDPLLALVPSSNGAKVLGGVQLLRKLGEGGMGAVYRGRHLRLEIDVAVKVMSPQLSGSGSVPDGDTFVKRFIREARTAAAINHPGVCRVLDVNVESGVYFIVMEFVEGEALSDLLCRLRESGRKMDEVDALRLTLGAAEALGEAHGRGVVHRDVKPQNLIREPNGRVKVIDLGIAKAAGLGEGARGGTLTGTQVIMGTIRYMAPEQTQSARDVGPQADVWSLGVLLFQMLTNELPFHDEDDVNLIVKIRNAAAPDLAQARAGLSAATRAIVERALATEPSGRFADGAAMADALRAAIGSLGSEAVTTPARTCEPSPSEAPARSRRGAMLLLIAAAMLAASGLLWSLRVPSLEGGTSLVYALDARSVPVAQRGFDLAARTAALMQQRLESAGFRGARAHATGDLGVVVEIPRMSETDKSRAKALASRGAIWFKIVIDPSDPRYNPALVRDIEERKAHGEYSSDEDEFDVATVAAAEGSNESKLLLQNDGAVSGLLIERAEATLDSGGEPAVHFSMKPAGRARLAATTEKCVGKQMAIVLDDVSLAAPVIRNPITDGTGVINGRFTAQEVANLVVVLTAGSLPAKPILQSERPIESTRSD